MESEKSVGGRARLKVLSHSCAPDMTRKPSYAYSQFLTDLGWIVDPSNHWGFNGDRSLRHFETGKALYFAQYDHEILFQVPSISLAYKGDEIQSSGRWDLHHDAMVDLIQGSEVAIIWKASQHELRSGNELCNALRLPLPKAQVYIIIEPLQSGLYCIRNIHESSPIFLQPPLDTAGSCCLMFYHTVEELTSRVCL